MKNVFIIADLHFGDSDMCNLLKADGHPMRPFNSVEEHDATLIENWNKVVTDPSDKVYVLGDVAQKRKDIENFGKLNGKKILIKKLLELMIVKKALLANMFGRFKT
jgi:calcineurin-like phosphoesterase family protein